MDDRSNAAPKSCGACTLCCKVMAIRELDKPRGKWCGHCRPGVGCTIYDERPPSCRAFRCLWLLDPLAPDFAKPDRSKAVLDVDSNGDRLVAHCDPATPTAWRNEPLYSYLKGWARKGWADGKAVAAMSGRRVWVITPNEDIDIGELDPRAPFSIEKHADGTVSVHVLPPRAEAEASDPAK